MGSPLQNFPIELLQEVSSYLSAADLIMLSSTCQKLRIALGQNSNSMWFRLVCVESESLSEPSSLPKIEKPQFTSRHHNYPLPPTWPSPHETTSECLVTFNSGEDYRLIILNYLWGYADRTMKPSRCRFCFNTTSEDSPLQNCQMRGYYYSSRRHEYDSSFEFPLPRYMTLCRRCEETKMIEISKDYMDIPIWNTDVSEIPVWRTFTSSSVTGNITLRSSLAKAVERAHREPYDTWVSRLEDRFTHWCNTSDKFMIPILVQIFSERCSDVLAIASCREIVAEDELKHYLESEWWKIWEFLPQNKDKKTVCQIRGLDYLQPARTIGGYDEDWSQSMYHQWDDQSRDFEWKLDFSVDLLQRLLSFRTFFHTGSTIRSALAEKYKPGRRGKSLPPFVPSVWRLTAHRFNPDQANLVGTCIYCAEKPASARYYSQFQYAMHLYGFHMNKLKPEDPNEPILWKWVADPEEYALTREQLFSSSWVRGPKARVSFRNFYCRKDDKTGDLYLCDHEGFNDSVNDYFIDYISNIEKSSDSITTDSLEILN